MTRLHSFKDNKGGCFSNSRMDNGDPVYISVAATGVLVKRSKIGFFGPKLYESRTAYDAAETARALFGLFPDYVGPQGMANAALRSFTNAVLHCSSTAEVAVVLNTAVETATESGIEPDPLAELDFLLGGDMQSGSKSGPG